MNGTIASVLIRLSSRLSVSLYVNLHVSMSMSMVLKRQASIAMN